MKQIKMDLSEELKAYSDSQDNFKKKGYLMKALKVLFTLGGGIGCFMLGSKYCELCISRGMDKVFNSYPNAEKVMLDSLKDYCAKNNIKL